MPRQRSASAGPAPAFSMLSANKRPSTPDVCSAKASVPASGPKPALISSSAAQSSSGMLRSIFNTERVMPRHRAGSSWCVLLAGTARAKPKMTASSVPSALMASVSSAAQPSLAKNLLLVSGTNISPTNLPIRPAASTLKNWAHFKSSVQKLTTVRQTRPNTNQHALHRASNSGGGIVRGDTRKPCTPYPSSLRNHALVASASHTSNIKTISMVATSEPLNIFIDASIC